MNQDSLLEIFIIRTRHPTVALMLNFFEEYWFCTTVHGRHTKTQIKLFHLFRCSFKTIFKHFSWYLDRPRKYAHWILAVLNLHFVYSPCFQLNVVLLYLLAKIQRIKSRLSRRRSRCRRHHLTVAAELLLHHTLTHTPSSIDVNVSAHWLLVYGIGVCISERVFFLFSFSSVTTFFSQNALVFFLPLFYFVGSINFNQKVYQINNKYITHEFYSFHISEEPRLGFLSFGTS